jgi:hypothetical protein
MSFLTQCSSVFILLLQKGTSYVFSVVRVEVKKDESVEIHYGDNERVSILLDHRFPVEDRIRAIQSVCKEK